MKGLMIKKTTTNELTKKTEMIRMTKDCRIELSFRILDFDFWFCIYLTQRKTYT